MRIGETPLGRRKAKGGLTQLRVKPHDHFVGAHEMVVIGSGAEIKQGTALKAYVSDDIALPPAPPTS
jgi:hypothetical protein